MDGGDLPAFVALTLIFGFFLRKVPKRLPHLRKEKREWEEGRNISLEDKKSPFQQFPLETWGVAVSLVWIMGPKEK